LGELLYSALFLHLGANYWWVLQDHDGSHIKGLLINFIHSFWPSLLKIPSFLVEFITPIVKVSPDSEPKACFARSSVHCLVVGRILSGILDPVNKMGFVCAGNE
jgi:hypothetical protein